MKDNQEDTQTLPNSAKERITTLKKDLKLAKVALQKVELERDALLGKINFWRHHARDSVTSFLKLRLRWIVSKWTLKRLEWTIFSRRDQGLEKEKTQTLFLYPKIDLSELDYFNIVVHCNLVDDIHPEIEQNMDDVPEIAPLSEEWKPVIAIVMEEGNPLMESSFEVTPNIHLFVVCVLLYLSK